MYQKTVLGNGIRVVTERIPYVHSVSTGIWISVGSRDEHENERGITHLIEHMLFKGTERRSALDIAKALDSVGGFANAFTSKEHVCFHAKVLSSHLPLVVDVLTDIFLNSVLSSEEIEREQQVIVQEIRMIEDTPDEFVHILFQELYWKGNPLGLPIYGTVETVESAGRQTITDYLSRTFTPDQIVIAAAGDLDHQAFVDLLSGSMGAFKSSSSEPNHRETPAHHFPKTILQKEIEQVHVCMGMQGPSQIDDKRFASHVLNVVLGSSMSSRLFQEIREKRGLAYSVYSFSNSHEDTGMLGVYAGVGSENVAETLELVHEQLSFLSAQPISQQELESAREYLRGSMYLNAESTDSRMNRLAKNEFLFGRHVPFEEVDAKIRAVSAEQVQAWFESVYKPDRVATVLYGPVPQDLEL